MFRAAPDLPGSGRKFVPGHFNDQRPHGVLTLVICSMMDCVLGVITWYRMMYSRFVGSFFAFLHTSSQWTQTTSDHLLTVGMRATILFFVLAGSFSSVTTMCVGDMVPWAIIRPLSVLNSVL